MPYTEPSYFESAEDLFNVLPPPITLTSFTQAEFEYLCDVYGWPGCFTQIWTHGDEYYLVDFGGIALKWGHKYPACLP